MERYNTYSAHLKKRFGEKVYKLPVNLPVTCPNRIEGRGCSFCAGVGTGFEAMSETVPVKDQLNRTKAYIGKRYGAKKVFSLFSELHEHISAPWGISRLCAGSTGGRRYCGDLNIHQTRLYPERLSGIFK